MALPPPHSHTMSGLAAFLNKNPAQPATPAPSKPASKLGAFFAATAKPANAPLPVCASPTQRRKKAPSAKLSSYVGGIEQDFRRTSLLSGDAEDTAVAAKADPAVVREVFMRQQRLDLDVVHYLIDKATDTFRFESTVLNLDAPVKVCGDIHGQFFDLMKLLDIAGLPDPDGSFRYLFLGDYVDRGAWSCEVMLYLLALKIQNPYSLFMLRGNHECRMVSGYENEVVCLCYE